MRNGLALAVSLLSLSTAQARTPIYLVPEDRAHITIAYQDFEDSDFDGSQGELGGSRSTLSAGYRGEKQPWHLGLGHSYDALDIQLSGAQPQTNGDLHTLHLAGSWTLPVAAGRLDFTLAPAVSASSNAIKDPGELDSDSLQLWGGASWRFPAAHWDWVLGVAHDYRFGRSRVYPMAGLTWRDENWSLWLTYPDVIVRFESAQGWSLAFSTSPDGNEWRAYSRDFERSDDFRREAWQSALEASYRWRNGLSVGVSAGYHWDQAWRIRREDGEQLRSGSDDAAFLGAQLAWSLR